MAQEAQEILLSSKVHLACMNHALSSEGEEIMGLLLGNTEPHPRGRGCRTKVWATFVMPRSEHKSDRVEVDPEGMVGAVQYAEKMTKASGIETRVIGWYHSHPHITCFPSHVDLRTQGSYQYLDTGWVGLIYSVFNSKAHTKCMDVHAFASGCHNRANDAVTFKHMTIPMHIMAEEHVTQIDTGNQFNSVVSLQESFLEEEAKLFEASKAKCEVTGSISGALYGASVYNKNAMRILQANVMPLMNTLQHTIQTNTQMLTELQDEELRLQYTLQQLQAEEMQFGTPNKPANGTKALLQSP
eukprot:TRINITY_DN105333_c0_g1_i1.p1 TRINITY_DN105333_c0_g1~~TRINITY_DN105333_c0_g1_i1.p1  ORF type:complete len:299 (-),score=6.71 TRINITY_DN105333_c0_g1_i1:28-924(-)